MTNIIILSILLTTNSTVRIGANNLVPSNPYDLQISTNLYDWSGCTNIYFFTSTTNIVLPNEFSTTDSQQKYFRLLSL